MNFQRGLFLMEGVLPIVKSSSESELRLFKATRLLIKKIKIKNPPVKTSCR